MTFLLTTDIIVGFPSETNENFRDTLKLAELCQFDSAYIFKYSPRFGTPAFEMIDDVTLEEKTSRFLEFEQQLLKTVNTSSLQRMIGKYC